MAAVAEDVVKALLSLDPKNDEHWNDDGLPRLDVVSKQAGRTVKRSEVTDADPKFNRDTAAGIVQPEAAPSKAATEPMPLVQGAQPQVDPEAPPPPSIAVVTEKLAELTPKIDAAEGLLNERFTALAEAKKVVEELQAKVDEANHALAQLLVQRDALPGHHANQAGILEYIKRQNEVRLEKHQVAMQLRQAGFRPKDMIVKSPLDQAMARKTQRGTQRPQLPVNLGR